jgi:hypothetical protein
MSTGIKSFGFDEGKDIKDNSTPKFKGEKGREEVFGFAWDVPSEIFRAVKGHYSKTHQKGWQCLSNEETKTMEVCCTHEYDGNEAKTKIGCAIVLYKYEKDPNTQQIVIKGIKDVMMWTFSPKTFQQLRGIYLEHGLVDIVATCTNTDFQNFTFVPRKGSTWTQREDSKNFVKGKATKIYNSLPKLMYNKCTISEIREHLGIASGSSDASTGMDLGGIANSLGG